MLIFRFCSVRIGNSWIYLVAFTSIEKDKKFIHSGMCFYYYVLVLHAEESMLRQKKKKRENRTMQVVLFSVVQLQNTLDQATEKTFSATKTSRMRRPQFNK